MDKVLNLSGFEEVLTGFKDINLDELRPPGFQQLHDQRWRSHKEKVDQRHGWREIDSCPVCRSTERSYKMERFGIDIWVCHECGLLYCGKIPRNISDVYAGEDYLIDAKNYYVNNMEYRKMRFGTERINLILSALGREKGDGLRLLDVGCGTGWFLDSAREAGFEVAGHEPGEALRKWTEQRLNSRIWGCDFTELPAGETFDVITMFDVIEHVSDPPAYLRSAREHLRPEGLLIVFTPNVDSLGIHEVGAQSSLIVPTDHLVYFSPSSFERAAAMENLRILSIETKGMDIADIASWEEDKNPETAAYLREKFSRLQPIVDAAGCSDHMRIILTL